MKPAIKFDQLDLTKLIDNLNKDVISIEEGDNNNVRAIKIADHIYNACKNSYKEQEENIVIEGNHINCSSSHFRAIAETNIFVHQSLSSDGVDTRQYLENWIKFEKLAKQAANKELDVRKKNHGSILMVRNCGKPLIGMERLKQRSRNQRTKSTL